MLKIEKNTRKKQIEQNVKHKHLFHCDVKKNIRIYVSVRLA